MKTKAFGIELGPVPRPRDDHGVDAMRYAAHSPAKRKRWRVAWLLVNRHGYPEVAYGPIKGHPSPRSRARAAAAKMNECGPTSDAVRFGPWAAVPAYYEPPPKRGR